MEVAGLGRNIDVGTRYEYVRALGKGAYGVALLMRAKDRDDELVAVKYIERGDQVDRNVEREIMNHRRLSGHPNIITFKEVFLTSTHLGIAMEYASGGTLFDWVLAINRFQEELARYLFQQLVCGLAWCHHKGVCHRDVKLENTLLDSVEGPTPKLKICDFGYSKSQDSDPKTAVGTPAYVAPEVLMQEKYNGEKADVWSCGVALYTMLYGQYPFQDPANPSSYRRMVQCILRGRYELPPSIPITPSCADLISRIFVKDPAQRLSLQQIREHPWFLINLPRECQAQGGDDAPGGDLPTQSEADIAAIMAAAREVLPQPPQPIQAPAASSDKQELLGLSVDIHVENQLQAEEEEDEMDLM